MEMTTRQLGSAIVIAPLGRLDHASADGFRAALEHPLAACTHEGAPLVLDFSGVDYVGSIGLRALMIVAKRAGAQGGRIAIAGLQPTVREVFEISRFNFIYKVFDHVDAAVKALA